MTAVPGSAAPRDPADRADHRPVGLAAVFLIDGTLGVLWAIGWWAWYRRPDVKSGVNDAERAIIHESHREEDAMNLHPEIKPMRIADLFKQRTVWGMMLGIFCLNFTITFFLTWFPSYLVNAASTCSSSEYSARSRRSPPSWAAGPAV